MFIAYYCIVLTMDNDMAKKKKRNEEERYTVDNCGHHISITIF